MVCEWHTFDPRTREVISTIDGRDVDMSMASGMRAIILPEGVNPEKEVEVDDFGNPIIVAFKIPDMPLELELKAAIETCDEVISFEHAKALNILTRKHRPEVRDTWPILLSMSRDLLSKDLDRQAAAIRRLSYAVPDCEAKELGLSPDTPETRAAHYASVIRKNAEEFADAVVAAERAKTEAQCALRASSHDLEAVYALMHIVHEESEARLKQFMGS